MNELEAQIGRLLQKPHFFTKNQLDFLSSVLDWYNLDPEQYPTPAQLIWLRELERRYKRKTDAANAAIEKANAEEFSEEDFQKTLKTFYETERVD